jgi:nucleoside-diphosphate-sugar epimerase
VTGPGTGQPEGWYEALAHPVFRIPGDGSGWLSPVHVRDFARAMLRMLEADAPRAACIACDDRPLTWRELFAALAVRSGRPVPATGGPMTLASFRTSNARLKSLGWRPQFALLEWKAAPRGFLATSG